MSRKIITGKHALSKDKWVSNSRDAATDRSSDMLPEGNMPPCLSSGMREKLGEVCAAAIASGAFPGIVLHLAMGNRTPVSIARGRLAWPAWTPEVSCDTVYDLASLTKPLATATLFMALASDGTATPEMPLRVFFRNLPSDKQEITTGALLTHTSGLPAHRPYFMALADSTAEQARHKMEKWIFEEPLCFHPGSDTLYSDLGYIVLGFVAEKICGMPLGQLVERYVFSPMGIKGIFWGGKGEFHGNCAPSEFCKYRERVIMGETHDMNAWILGGAAGHAGLFATAARVAGILKALMDIKRGKRRHPHIRQDVLNSFLSVPRREGCGNCRTMGFDTPLPGASAAGKHFSPASIGHLGFTGTSFWHDTEKDITITMLANRTFPRADKKSMERIRKWRPLIHDAAMEMLTGDDRRL